MSSFNRLFALAFAMLFCAAAFIQGATPVVYANVATYVVDNTGDADLASNASACANSGQNNDCSLRQAIELANQDGGASSITFNIPTDDANYSSGTWTIRPNSDLPPLSEGETTILGTADQINPSLPAIIINGSNVPASSAVGLTISSADNRIERLAILDFNGNLATTGIGIHITGPNASGNVVRGSFIGVRPGDTTATTLADRQRVGIQIDGGASGNFIGEAASLLSDRNFIAGNGLSTGDGGIIILQSNNNTIQNNYIGFNLAGSAFVDLGNTGSGIQVINSAGNTIGGTVAGATPLRNYIANNTQYGIVITGDPSDNNLVAGNYIGVNVDGTSARPNALDGVIIAGSADNNTISGNAAVRSVISGNTQYGVRITAVGTTGNRIQGVYIGTNAAGTAAIPNVIGGVRVENSANGNVVGGESAALGNLISGNPVGVSIGAAEGFTVQNTVVAGNVVGLNAAGTAAVPNTSRGISIEARARQTTIGGATSGEANYIAGNGGPGVAIVGGANTLTTTLQLNTIGLRRATGGGAYTTLAGNTIGVSVTLSSQGTTLIANTIAGSSGPGVRVDGPALNTTIQANTVISNTTGGIIFNGANTRTIINSSNLLRANGSGPGLQLGDAVDTLVADNTLEFNSGGILGGTLTRTTLSGNTIRGNTGASGYGINLGGGSNIAIRSSEIYTNTQAGIQLGSSNTITLTLNTVSENGGNGIVVGSGTGLELTSNLVISNTTSGILLTSRTGGVVNTNTVTDHSADGIVLASATNLEINDNVITRNGQRGLAAGGTNLRIASLTATDNGQTGLALSGVTSATVQLSTLNGNDLRGLLIDSGSLITVTTNTTINANGSGGVGTGVLLTGTVSQVRIEDTTIYSNTLYGVQIGQGSGSQQQVQLTNNRISGNGISGSAPYPTDRGIVLTPDTIGSGGNNSNPNHDIEPPIAATLKMNQSGQLFGTVDVTVGQASACLALVDSPCVIEAYRTNPTTLDGQGSQRITAVSPNAGGAFTANLGTPLPPQVALTATDGAGNTSRFGVFTLNPALTITPARSSSAEPGQVITYTHYVTNSGNLDLADLRLEYESTRNWDQITFNPPGNFALQSGQGRLVTVTVRLPTGTDERVNAGGSPDLLTVRVRSAITPAAVASVVNTTTVLAKVVIAASPTTILQGVGQPGDVLPYAFTITNNGNINATIGLAISTNLGSDWQTTLTPNVSSLSLERGESVGLIATVRIPPFSTGVVSGTQALTTLAVSVTSPATPSENKTLQAQTTVGLAPRAVIVEPEVADGAANELSSFLHTVTNTSNGRAVFVLNAISSLGSTITFREGDAVDLTGPGNNTFELGTGVTGEPPIDMQFFADVLVTRFADRGDVDTITIFLTDSQGRSVPNAFVQDRINITRGTMRPRQYFTVLSR